MNINMQQWIYGRLAGVSRIPEGWKLVTLTNEAKLESGHTPDRDTPAYWTGGIPWLSLHDTKQLDLPVVVDTRLHISELGIANSSARLLPPGTVALSRTATVGKCVILGRAMATSQDFACYVCGSHVHNKYLLHLFRYMQPTWRSLAGGSTHQTVYMPVFKRLQVMLPTTEEQRRIAEILDTVDKSIRSTERLIAKLHQARVGLLRSNMTGDQSYERVQLSNMIPRAEYGISSPLDYEGKTPVLRMNNIADGEVELTDLKSTSVSVHPGLMLRPGDVLFNRTNSIDHVGRTGIWRGEAGTHTFASYLVRLICDPLHLEPEYLNLWMQLPETQINIRAFATPGVHQVNINPTNLRKTWMMVPRMEEQRSVINLMAAHSTELTLHKAELSKLKKTRLGLMEDLLTGRVRVEVD